MRIMISEPICLTAYTRVVVNHINSASISSNGKYKEIGYVRTKDELHSVVLYEEADLREITLTDSGRDHTTWVGHKYVTKILARQK